MNIRSITLLAFATLFSFAVFAQQGSERKIKFEETTHNFGEMDKGADASHTFQFTNVSESPVTLTRVKASCGCTTPKWTKEEVAPGESGEIAVSYNSQRIGAFSKTVTVTYDSIEGPIVLYIKGKVNNTVDPIAQAYPARHGNLAFDKVSEQIGVLPSDGEKEVVFKVTNVGPQPITIQRVENEMMFDVALGSETIIPGQKAEIKVKAKGGSFIVPGTFSNVITLHTDDPAQPHKPLNISGTLEKVYSEAELAAMPNIEFVNTTYDAGKVLEGEKVQIAFQFTNTGQEDLVIESVKASCGCTASAPKDKVVKAGQTSEIQATFNSRGRQGIQNKSVTVRTNDPDNPTIVLRLKVEVEQDPFHMGSDGPAASPNGINRR